MKFHLDKNDTGFIKAVAKEVVRILDERKPIVEPETLPPSKFDHTFTVKEAAKIVNKATSTIRSHIKLELLIAAKTGKAWTITQDNLDKYIGNGKQQ